MRPVVLYASFPIVPSGESNRWLLRLHGSVSMPGTIVLTREDYMRFEERRAALARIVQTLLLTRHMLVIGFGLRDDNFHRIADAVRRALGERRSNTSVHHFGTALVIVRHLHLECSTRNTS